MSGTAEPLGEPAEWLGGRWRTWEHGEDLALILSEGDSNCLDTADPCGCSDEMECQCPGGGKKHLPASTERPPLSWVEAESGCRHLEDAAAG